MAQRKDSPDTPTKGGSKTAGITGGGNARSAGKGGGKSASAGDGADMPRSTTPRREKASPSARDRGETSTADRA